MNFRSLRHLFRFPVVALAMLAAALLLPSGHAFAQANAANYSFSTTVTGSLTDMTSGTIQLVAENQDDTASAVTLIGFDFYFMGARQDRFTVTSNGMFRFGATITYTVTDAFGNSNRTTFTVTVKETPSLVVSTISDMSTNIDGQTSLREALACAASLDGSQTVTFSNSAANGAENFYDEMPHVIALNGTVSLTTSRIPASAWTFPTRSFLAIRRRPSPTSTAASRRPVIT